MTSSEERSRVLIVDDHRETCQILAKTLELRQYDVDYATSASEALKLATGRRYDLALLDYRMPELNGVELFEALRSIQPELIAVFLTGYPTVDTVFPAVRAGVERLLAKPVDGSELLNVLDELLATR